jgi:hypothetical protein
MEQRTVPPESFSAETVADVLKTAERLAREQVAGVIADRMREIEPALRTRLHREFERSAEARAAEARRDANREYSEQLSRCVRRMREDAESWANAVLDATVGSCRRAALYAVADGKWDLKGVRGASRDSGTVTTVDIGNGSALASVVNEGRTVFASCSDEDLGDVAGVFGRADDGRVALVPIVARGRASHVICAQGIADLGTLEMIGAIAAAVLAARSGVGDAISPRAAELPADVAARRFARDAVSRLVMERFDDLKAGRASRSVYRSLAEPLDAARAEYRRTHLVGAGRDWLHEEIVRFLGQGRPELLGADYPGPLA